MLTFMHPFCNTIVENIGTGVYSFQQQHTCVISGILPLFGNKIDGYRNSKRMAIDGMMKRLCKEEDVGYVDFWDSFVGKEDM